MGSTPGDSNFVGSSSSLGTDMLFKIPPEEYKVQPVLKQGVAPGQRFPMHTVPGLAASATLGNSQDLHILGSQVDLQNKNSGAGAQQSVL